MEVPPIVLPCPLEMYCQDELTMFAYLLYSQYRGLLSRVKVLRQVLENYMRYTPKMWTSCSFRERQQIMTRLDQQTYKLQSDVEATEMTFDNFSCRHRNLPLLEVRGLRRRLDYLLQELNTMLCSLDQIMRSCHL